MCVVLICVLVFKQKTAYEMRISCWSSDVCSSDLGDRAARARADPGRVAGDRGIEGQAAARDDAGREPARRRRPDQRDQPGQRKSVRPVRDAGEMEEHTSELQSLMRISYAVFCLKKKT